MQEVDGVVVGDRPPQIGEERGDQRPRDGQRARCRPGLRGSVGADDLGAEARVVGPLLAQFFETLLDRACEGFLALDQTRVVEGLEEPGRGQRALRADEQSREFFVSVRHNVTTKLPGMNLKRLGVQTEERGRDAVEQPLRAQALVAVGDRGELAEVQPRHGQRALGFLQGARQPRTERRLVGELHEPPVIEVSHRRDVPHDKAGLRELW